MTPTAFGPGAHLLAGGRSLFRVWAPNHDSLSLRLEDAPPIAMRPISAGYFELEADATAGTRYRYVLPGGEAWPDPASRSQPDGVHGPSAVVDTSFAWTDRQWQGLTLEDTVVYELHVGTFTPGGTFDDVIPELPRLKELGVTAIELLPVAQFPGTRNWGYDGTYPYAVQHSYGGLEGLQRLVDAGHALGLAVGLDVVHNHLGPEGNYAPQFGPYFSDDYRTPWGAALNFDGPGSDEVREFFISSAIFWMEAAHIDFLRLDAAHAILDAHNAVSFLEELSTRVAVAEVELGRTMRLIAETSLNDPRYVEPVESGGRGLDGQWNDDFHHALHSLLTGERDGYYIDYGDVGALARCYLDGYRLQGDYSEFYHRRHGRPSAHIEPSRMVVFSQNHDQVGNRPRSDRLSTLVDFESLKLAAAAVIFSPYIPLLFMGEEWGETAPFWFFVDHGDPGLVNAVREGRAREYASMGLGAGIADPGDPATYEDCTIDSTLKASGRGATLYRFYTELLQLRRSEPLLHALTRPEMRAETIAANALAIHRQDEHGGLTLYLNFAEEAVEVRLPGGARLLHSSADAKWDGPGAGDLATRPFMQSRRSAMLIGYPASL